MTGWFIGKYWVLSNAAVFVNTNSPSLDQANILFPILIRLN